MGCWWFYQTILDQPSELAMNYNCLRRLFLGLTVLLVSICFEGIGTFRIRVEQSSGVWEWIASTGGGGSHTKSMGVAVDDSGNSYICGFVSKRTSFGDFILQPLAEAALFAAKYNPSGKCIWVKSFGEAGVMAANGIALSKDGTIYIVGTLGESAGGTPGIATIGRSVLRSGSTGDLILLKLESNGEIIWGKQLKCSGNASGSGVSIDLSGNAYVVGFYEGVIEGTKLKSRGKRDILIAKFKHDGQILWLKGEGGPGWDEGHCVKVDSEVGFVVAGAFEGKMRIGSHVFDKTGLGEFIVIKYDSSGNIVWANRSNCGGVANGVVTDLFGNCYVTGEFGGTLVFGKSILTSIGSYKGLAARDAFLGKYDKNGKPQWAIRTGGVEGADVGNSVSVDALGNVYFTGSFFLRAVFGEYSVSADYGEHKSRANRQMFLAKYDSFGNFLWVSHSRGSDQGEVVGNSIAIGKGGFIITGFYTKPTHFDNILLSEGSQSIFLAKFSSEYRW